MKKLGLVLAGGGGKGAYQIGVWKYLKEIGLDKKVSVVSGTSVGALNATMFATMPCEKAEYIWTHEIKDKILKPKTNLYADTILSVFDLLMDGFSGLRPFSLDKLITAVSPLLHDGVWSRDGLMEIIDKYVDFSKLENAPQKIYATCCKMPLFEKKSFLLNDKQPSVIKQILCATSAIPFVFKSQTVKANNGSSDFSQIENEDYIDGGIVDNVPCSPTVAAGCTDIIVVNLSSGKRQGKYSDGGINYVVITPSKDLGNVFDGTLDFSESGAKHRIELGYDDCKNFYAQLLGDLCQQKHLLGSRTNLNLLDEKRNTL